MSRKLGTIVVVGSVNVDLLLRRARVITVDDDRPRASTVAVVDDDGSQLPGSTRFITAHRAELLGVAAATVDTDSPATDDASRRVVVDKPLRRLARVRSVAGGLS